MITILDLAKKIAQGLEEYSVASEHENFEFYVSLDELNLKTSKNINGKKTFYINGLLKQLNPINRITTNNLFTAIISRFDIIVPILNDTDDGLNTPDELVNTVRNVLDGYFNKNSLGSIQDETGKLYDFNMNYIIIPETKRVQRAIVGDSLLLPIYINSIFTEQQDNFQVFEISIDGVLIPYTRLGIRRDASLEGNVPSSTVDGAAHNVTAATLLSLNFDMQALSGEIYNKVINFLLNGGNNVGHLITIRQGEITKNFIMTFSESSLNLETDITGSISVSLGEVMTENGIYTYTPAARAYLEDR